ncbi:pre-rRNA-processing protein TSR2 homolog isoform X2 [Lingula anatina]|uniref:Pre-rRNA-processing protein TSR2 homolog n=1 Tax=Lingula anatina TaxID=7574 RepID=A0A1S3JFS8_LINAN|nr:pre-rRNA-processing protein TSR2 homolog isoform X2 [Lingula anatina]|eukprot:XP_013409213.1 pre-rRNA-processing protein TSR2 homolog isoform X2 [Lingula anatina]
MASGPSTASVFYKAIEKVLKGWTAFQLAVSHGFGGAHTQEKAVWLVGAVEQWFTENDDIEPWELSDFFEDIMSTEFDTVIDDNSLLVVSKAICQFYALCKQGKEAEVLADVEKIPTASLQNCVVAQDEDEDDDEEEEEEVPRLSQGGASRLQPEPMDHQSATEGATGCDNTTTENSDTKTEDQSSSQDAEMEEEWTTVTSKKKKRR